MHPFCLYHGFLEYLPVNLCPESPVSPQEVSKTAPMLYSFLTEEHRHHGQAEGRSTLHTIHSDYLLVHSFQELANPLRGLGT